MREFMRHAFYLKSKGAYCYLLARIYAVRGNWLLAERYFSYALEKKFRHKETQRRLATVILHQKNWSRVLEAYEPLVARFQQIDDYLTLAKAYNELGDFHNAIRTIHEGLEHTPHNAKAIKFRDALLRKLDNSSNNVRFLEKLVHDKKNHEILPYAMCLSRLYCRSRKPHKVTQLLSILLEKTNSKKQKINLINEFAYLCEQNLYWKAAEKIYVETIKSGMYNAYTVAAVGMINERLGRHMVALQFYDMGIREFKHVSKWFYFRAGQTAYMTKKYKKASTYFINSMQLRDKKIKRTTLMNTLRGNSPYKEVAAYRLGCLYNKTINYEQSCKYFLQSRCIPKDIHNISSCEAISTGTQEVTLYEKIDQTNFETIKIEYLEWLNLYGEKFRLQNLWQSAFVVYERIFYAHDSQDKISEHLYKRLIETSWHSEYFSKAVNYYRYAIDLYPNSLQLHTEHALTLNATGHYARELKQWELIYDKFFRDLTCWHAMTAAKTFLRVGDLNNFAKWDKLADKLKSENSIQYFYYKMYVFSSIRHQLKSESLILGKDKYSNHYSTEEVETTIKTVAKKIIELSKDKVLENSARQRISQILLDQAEYILINGDVARFKHMLWESIAILIQNNKLKKYHLSLYECIVKTRIKGNSHDAEDALVSALKKAPPHQCSIQEWLNLYDFLCYNNLLNVAFLVRNIAVKSALIQPSEGASFQLLRMRALAEAETCQYTSAYATLRLINTYYPQDSRHQQLLNLVSLQAGDTHLIHNVTRNTSVDNEAELTMDKLITGKSVAIVGPAPNKLKSGNEIDRSEAVVRFNYRGKDFLNKKELTGTKTTISYLNGPYARKYLDGNTPEYLSDLQLYCLSYSHQERNEEDIANGKARLYGYITFLFHGSTNAVPMSLIDIIKYHPRSVKIYNSNLYLSHKQYDKKYNHHSMDPSPRIDIMRLREMVTNHDFISQLRFLRNCYSSGVIEVDEDCKRVLSLSDEAYMNQMQDIFNSGL